MVLLRELIAQLDQWYPPSSAESWDAVGLTCGDPDEVVDTVLLAIDCVPATVEQATSIGAQLLLTHHPLLLSGVHGVAADTPKGALIHRLVRHGAAHFAAHTNADIAEFGVSAALADVLGLRDPVPLLPVSGEPVDQLAVFVPPDYRDRVVDALADAGAGTIGEYDRCTFNVEGVGTYRPLPGSDPFHGTVGELTRTPEIRVSTVFPRRRRAAVLAAMRTAHPYEAVAFELTEQPPTGSAVGSGRIGTLAEPMSLRDFIALVARRLPRTAGGVRAAGDPDRPVTTVAVCGGAGGSLTDQARAAGADAFVTGDLKHHATSEAVDEWFDPLLSADPAMALIDATHYGTEAVWLPVLADRLRACFGDVVAVTVSDIVTDPWTLHVPH